MTVTDDTDGLTQLSELMRDERVPERSAPAPRKPKNRKRRLIAGGIAAVVVLGSVGGYVGWALTAPVGAADSVAQAPDVPVMPAASIVLSQDGISAVSVAGADEYLGPDASTLFAENGLDKVRPIASITKLITALVILDKKPLKDADDPGPTLTFSKADHDLYDDYYVLGATIAEMPTGSSMKLHDVLETMLVVSACNYAEVASNWAFGSQSAFLSATKTWLKENGLTHTTVVEPTGLNAGNTSSPADLMKLARLAMANPAVAQIVAMPRLAIKDFDQMPTTNTLLGIDGVTGMKTGTLKDSGSNLLFSATVSVGTGEPLELLGVVLGGYSRESVNADVRALIASLQEGFHAVPVAEQGQEVGTYTTPWGESARMVLKNQASIFTWSDTPIEATIDTTTLKSGADGETVGSVTWTAGTQTVSVLVVLEGSISPPDQWWRLTHPFELGG